MRSVSIVAFALLLAAAPPAIAAPAHVRYVRDPAGRLAAQFSGGVAIVYTHDAAGNVTRRHVCEGACFIDGECRDEGAAAPDNACLSCASATDEVAWTPSVGAACDDGDPATTGDACTAEGTCVGVAVPPEEEDDDGGGCCEVQGGTSQSGAALLAGLVALLVFGPRRRSAGGRR